MNIRNIKKLQESNCHVISPTPVQTGETFREDLWPTNSEETRIRLYRKAEDKAAADLATQAISDEPTKEEIARCHERITIAGYQGSALDDPEMFAGLVKLCKRLGMPVEEYLERDRAEQAQEVAEEIVAAYYDPSTFDGWSPEEIAEYIAGHGPEQLSQMRRAMNDPTCDRYCNFDELTENELSAMQAAHKDDCMGYRMDDKEESEALARELGLESIMWKRECEETDLTADDLEVIARSHGWMDEWTLDELWNFARENGIDKTEVDNMKQRLRGKTHRPLTSLTPPEDKTGDACFERIAAAQTISDKWSQEIVDWARENGIPTDAAYIKRFRALNSELDSPELSDEAFYRLAMKKQTDANQRMRDILMKAEARAEPLTRAYDDYMDNGDSVGCAPPAQATCCSCPSE